jgi:flagellar basal-body rod modification protein FlgD
MATDPLANIRKYDPAAASQTTTTSAGVGGTVTEQTQNFLKLLIAQIQNQDPMAPMDASSMTSQMSQLNMVSSIGDMNKSMTAMLSQMQSVNFMNQAALIGHSPVVAGGGISFDGTNAAVLGANAVNPLTSAVATIKDANGNTVNSMDMGSLDAGMNNFAWDGKDADGNTMPAGMYYLSISGTSTTGAKEIPTAYVASPVMSVSKGSNGDALLSLLDGRKINASEIQQWIS